MNSPEGVEGVDYKLCRNCQQRIPPAQITMHELRCERINWYCELCKVVVLKSDREKHTQQFHLNYVCEWCGEEMENRKVLEHKKTDCPGRNVVCRFCKLMMQYRKMWTHEQSCGAVTEICSKCNSRYARRDMESHEKTCSKITVPYKVPPRRPSFANNNDMMLCEKCQQPFASFEELQVHIFTEHHTELDEMGGFFGNDTTDTELLGFSFDTPNTTTSSTTEKEQEKEKDKDPKIEKENEHQDPKPEKENENHQDPQPEKETENHQDPQPEKETEKHQVPKTENETVTMNDVEDGITNETTTTNIING